MTRFFLDRILPLGQMTVELTGADAHHLRDVLRARPGEAVVICDAAATDHRCEVIGSDAERVVLAVVERLSAETEPPYEAVLLQGLVKGDRMDVLVQKSVELGVSRIVPFAAARSVVRLDREDGVRKSERWSRIAEEAAKQCGRSRIPRVDPPVPFDEALGIASRSDLSFLPWELESERSLLTWRREERTELVLRASARNGRPPTLAFLIGPEGGFDGEEVRKALSAGLATISLGRRILRAETAGPAVLAQLSLLLEMDADAFRTPRI
jgi:16S rRNA (uracil1498-N3)-methyltransferase